jgi:Spy/CpxP family protein refolding chaperone
MKNARKGSLLLVMTLGLSLALAGSVWAQTTKSRGGAISLTPKQAAEMFDLKEKYNAETVNLRRDLVIKRAELDALKAAEKPDQDALQAKQQELMALTE